MTFEEGSLAILDSMVDIILVHRKSKQEFSQLQSHFKIEAPVWKTCLRQLVFVPREQWNLFQELNDLSQDEVRFDQEALQFLVEVLCGLHSPVFGETEVFSQYKAYVAELPSQHLLRRVSGLHDMILRTVKEVRHAYLQEAGTFSYGQMIRRKLKKGEQQVCLWGSGQLGKKVLRYLKDKNVILLVRDPARVRQSLALDPDLKALKNVEVMDLKEAASLSAQVHVIAAPVSNEKLIEVLEKHAVCKFIDLRGETELVHPRVTSLKELMREIQVLKAEQLQTLPVCRQLIQERVEEYFQLALHRPFCWEDLCG